ncbi:unnamed protein product [Onchocerca flexuosa]|uniref:Glutathionylspermidine synthase n=1 Tax=Onchocerca flexuosa TaxID=387005 RepID=A0A183GXS5_9BILA|nr:unnamed protein product [Onchocerca flexuosa]
MIGFDDILYFNDPNYPWYKQDITHEEFEKAAQPLCNGLVIYAKKNAKYNSLYYAAWVKTKKNIYNDIFLLCCMPCPVAKTEVQWRITLKLQFLIRQQYNLINNYILDEVHAYINDTQPYIIENYYITNRMPEMNASMKMCNAENFKKVPITTNNNVCFVTASDILDRSSLFERQTEQTRDRMAHEIIRLGPYTAAKIGYMKDLQCRIQHTSHEDNECVVWMTYDEYGYECCCYGDLIDICQDRISNSILVGIEQLTAYNEFMACAISKNNNTTYNYKYDKKTRKITLRGKMQDILNGIRIESYCPLYLEILNTEYKYYLSLDEFLTEKSDHSVLTSGMAAGCHYYANWDIRLMDIVKTRCIQLIRKFDIVKRGLILNKINRQKIDYHCKYNSQYQFLFNDLFIIDKSSRSCLLHYIDSITLLDMDSRLPDNDFVLFQQPGCKEAISKECSKHLMKNEEKKDQFSELSFLAHLNYYPASGSAFYPIDFSYALLEDGKCRYIEVEVNLNYTNLQSCQETVMFKTNYMPLKIFACRCRTEVGSRTPCDEKLASEIMNLARSWPLENSTQCIQYNEQKLQDLSLNQMETIFPTHTSYCYTEMTLKKSGNGPKFYVSGGGVTHTIARNAEKHLNHIAYAMWLEAGSVSSLCSKNQKGKALCFCRSYNNHPDACNEDIWQHIKLQKILIMQELHFTVFQKYFEIKTLTIVRNKYEMMDLLLNLIFSYCFHYNLGGSIFNQMEYSFHQIQRYGELQIRKEYLNTLSDHLVQKGETWCHSPEIYGTLDIDMENADVITSGKCVRAKPESKTKTMREFSDDRIFCAELKALENKCIAKVTDTKYLEKNRLICCCKRKCEAVGFIIQSLAKNIADNLEIY